MRFYDPGQGAVLADGTDIRSLTVASWRAQLGVVFQETFLFDTTIRENIEMARPGATDAEIEAASQAAELHEFITDLPRGYDELVRAGGTYAQLWGEQTGGEVAAEVPFDAAGALARLPVFAGLDADALAGAAARLRAEELAAGARVPEGGGRLVLVRRGRAAV